MSSTIWPILWIFLTITVGIAVEAAAAQEQGESRFTRTLLALNTAVDAQRLVFANIAITQLLEIYTAEADLARNEARDRKNRKLEGWAAAVEEFNKDLFIVLEDLEGGVPVFFSIRPHGRPAALLVAGRAVLLTHPRADQQVSYEQQILGEFCRRENCDQLTALQAPTEAMPVSVVAKKPMWSFTEGGPVCFSGAGDVQVQFPSVIDLPLFRRQCKKLLHEIAALKLDIRWQARHGVTVEGDKIAIEQQASGREHRVRLNTTGDSVLLALPLLYSNPHVVQVLALWIADHIANDGKQVLRVDAVDITWDTSQ